SREPVLLLPALRCRGRHRCFCFAQLVFLLRLSRAGIDSHFPAHWNLGDRQSARRRLESDNLSCARKCYPAGRLDHALSRGAFGRTQSRSSSPTGRRFRWPDGARHWSGLLLVLLLANIIYIGLVTIAQRRLDWMLGYSSVMHMGYIFLGIASANILGTTGAAILMFAHGLSIALLFAITGEIRKRVSSLDFEAMGGLAKQMPLAAFAFGLGVFAAIGLPGFSNFAAEIMVVFGAFRNGFDYQHFHIFQWATLLALWGVVISAIYMLRAYRRTFFGSPAESGIAIADIRSGFRFPIALLVAASILFGFFPQIAVQRIAPAFRNYFTA